MLDLLLAHPRHHAADALSTFVTGGQHVFDVLL